MDFILAAGQVHDVNAVDELLANVDADAFIADKAYDADGVIDTLKARNIQPVIPPRRNRRVQRDYDKQMYKGRCIRNVISSSGSSINSSNSEA